MVVNMFTHNVHVCVVINVIVEVSPDEGLLHQGDGEHLLHEGHGENLLDKKSSKFLVLKEQRIKKENRD